MAKLAVSVPLGVGPVEVPENDIQVNVLGPAELVVNGQPLSLGDSPLLSRLLTLLALGPEKGMSAQVLINEIWRDRRVRNPEGSLQQAVRRLRRAGLGDCLPAQKGGRYRLDLSARRIDARRLIAMADALDSPHVPDDAGLDEVLGLWRGDPTADTGLPDAYGRRARQAKRRLETERRKRTKPRLLILDDKVGRRIATILGDYQCTVMTELDDFWPVADRCDDLFDAALVDLHLNSTDSDAEGLAVVDALWRCSVVPTVLMSYKPQEGQVEALIQRYNLFSFFVKGSNTESGNFTGLRGLVTELLAGNVGDLLVQRIDEDLTRCERKAGKRILLLNQGETAKKAMEAEVDRVRRVIRENGTLAEARSAMARFTSKWLPEDR
jgi:hypothetical protein